METIEKVTTFGAITICIGIGVLIGYFIGKGF